jgi:hypothetical protein
MNKLMIRRKLLGLTVDILILISIFINNDISYLKFIGICAILLIIYDTYANKL